MNMSKKEFGLLNVYRIASLQDSIHSIPRKVATFLVSSHEVVSLQQVRLDTWKLVGKT